MAKPPPNQRNLWANAGEDGWRLCVLLLRPALVHHLQVSLRPHLSHACFSSTIPCLAWIGEAGDKKMGCRKGCTSDLGLAMHA